MPDYLVGCDVGTSGTKSVVIDKNGDTLGQHFIGYPLLTNESGYVEHDPERYWNAVAETIKKAVFDSGVDPGNIKGVGISALSPACILIDKDLQPLQLAHIWMDRRGTKQSEWLLNNIGEDRIFALSGNIIDPYLAMVKLMWERDNRPGLYKKAYKIQSAADYPAMRLTGVAVTDYSNASLYGIAFDIRKKIWDEKLLKEINIDISKLPDVYPCESIIGYVTKEAAPATGLCEGTPVTAGTVDCSASWLANGALEDGDSSIVMGTAGIIGVVHEKDIFIRDMINIIHSADSRKMYATLSAQLCGGLYKYFRDIFTNEPGTDSFEIMNTEAEKLSPGSEGIIILPYFQGERTPIWDPYARGMIFGLSLNHKKGHLVRAIMEAAGYAFRHNYIVLKKGGLKINLPFTVSEGGAKSRLWRQIVSDMLEEQLILRNSESCASFGSAIIAGVGTGVFNDFSIIKKWLKVADRVEPIIENSDIYKKYYKVFLNLYSSNKNIFPELAILLETSRNNKIDR